MTYIRELDVEFTIEKDSDYDLSYWCLTGDHDRCPKEYNGRTCSCRCHNQ